MRVSPAGVSPAGVSLLGRAKKKGRKREFAERHRHPRWSQAAVAAGFSFAPGLSLENSAP